jgi:hypothetical protein
MREGNSVKVDKTAGVTSVTAAKKAKPAAKGELESIRIERAGNGFMVYVSNRPADSNKGKNPDYGYSEPSKEVFTDVEALLGFVRSELGAK